MCILHRCPHWILGVPQLQLLVIMSRSYLFSPRYLSFSIAQKSRAPTPHTSCLAPQSALPAVRAPAVPWGASMPAGHGALNSACPPRPLLTRRQVFCRLPPPAKPQCLHWKFKVQFLHNIIFRGILPLARWETLKSWQSWAVARFISNHIRAHAPSCMAYCLLYQLHPSLQLIPAP